MKNLNLSFLTVFIIFCANSKEQGNPVILSDHLCGTITEIPSPQPHFNPSDYKFVAKIFYNNNTKFCYANIISNQWLLGAAACLPDKIPMANYTVFLSMDLTSRNPKEIAKIVKSPKYNPTLGAGYDLALIKMKQTMQFNDKSPILPICLSDYDGKHTQKFGPSSTCYDISGKEIKLSEDSLCQEYFQYAYKPQYMLCSTKRNTARNGAPIICKDEQTKRWYLGGLSSWASSVRNEPTTYEAYTKLFADSDYIVWINSTIHPAKVSN